MLVCIVVECPAPATKNKKSQPMRLAFLFLYGAADDLDLREK